jgi:hypothetical protein
LQDKKIICNEIFKKMIYPEGDRSKAMNVHQIKQYFYCLNEELEKINIKGELCMVGGAVMCLCFGSRQGTVDIDAIFEPKIKIYECAKIVSEIYGLPEDWLNDGVKGFLSSNSEFNLFLQLSNLKIFVPSTEYMLAMKCLSCRTENADELDDIKVLLEALQIKSVEQVTEIITKFYSLKRFNVKLQYVLEDLLNG